MYKIEELEVSSTNKPSTFTHSQRTLHFGDVEHTIYIPEEYILEQRANSNCSLGEADVIQNVMKGVLGEDEKELETTVAKRTKSGMLYVLVEKAN